METELFTIVPPAAIWAAIIGLFIAVFFFLLKGIESGVVIWRHTRKTPPVEEVIAELATKNDIQGVRGSIKEAEVRLNTRIDELDQRQSEEIRRMRSYNSDTTSEIFETIRTSTELVATRLETATTSIQAELRSMNKDLGRLQGQNEQRGKGNGG